MSASCSTTAAGVCSECSECGDGFVETGSCTADRDTVCEPMGVEVSVHLGNMCILGRCSARRVLGVVMART